MVGAEAGVEVAIGVQTGDAPTVSAAALEIARDDDLAIRREGQVSGIASTGKAKGDPAGAAVDEGGVEIPVGHKARDQKDGVRITIAGGAGDDQLAIRLKYAAVDG